MRRVRLRCCCAPCCCLAPSAARRCPRRCTTTTSRASWPSAPGRRRRCADPSNRVVGPAGGHRLRPAAVPRAARCRPTAASSCASCHQPARGFSDGLPRGTGLADAATATRRRCTTSDLQRWFGWDGANDNLWAQSLRPLLDAREMGGSLDAGGAHRARRSRRCARPTAPPSAQAPGADDERVAVDVAKALAAWQATLRQRRARPSTTSATRWRAATARPRRATRQAAQRGLALFLGRGRCYICHARAELQQRRVPRHRRCRFFVGPAGSTRAATAASSKLQASRYNLLGPVQRRRRRAARATRHAARARWSTATSASSRCRACATCAHRALHARRQPGHAARRGAPLLRAERGAAACRRRSASWCRCSLSAPETADLLAFLDSLNAAPAARR